LVRREAEADRLSVDRGLWADHHPPATVQIFEHDDAEDGALGSVSDVPLAIGGLADGNWNPDHRDACVRGGGVLL